MWHELWEVLAGGAIGVLSCLGGYAVSRAFGSRSVRPPLAERVRPAAVAEHVVDLLVRHPRAAVTAEIRGHRVRVKRADADTWLVVVDGDTDRARTLDRVQELISNRLAALETERAMGGDRG